MKNLLFPTDFSEVAYNALQFAGAMAYATGAQIELLHTYRIPIDYPVPTYLLDDINTEEDQSVNRLLDAVIKKYFEEHPEHKDKVTFIKSSLQGFTSDVIIERAKEGGHDMIVMGTKGASGMEEIFLGSMTTSIIEEAACPVLAIPEDAKFEGINDLIYASDFSPKDYDSLHQLATFAKFFDAKTHCVHISDDENYFIDDVSFDLMRDQYQAYFPKDSIDFKVLLGKGIEDGLAECIESHKADIVAMTTRKRSFLERLFSRSKTKKMAFHSKVPLLAFHE